MKKFNISVGLESEKIVFMFVVLKKFFLVLENLEQLQRMCSIVSGDLQQVQRGLSSPESRYS